MKNSVYKKARGSIFLFRRVDVCLIGNIFIMMVWKEKQTQINLFCFKVRNSIVFSGTTYFSSTQSIDIHESIWLYFVRLFCLCLGFFSCFVLTWKFPTSCLLGKFPLSFILHSNRVEAAQFRLKVCLLLLPS